LSCLGSFTIATGVEVKREQVEAWLRQRAGLDALKAKDLSSVVHRIT